MPMKIKINAFGVKQFFGAGSEG